ncbi:beta strand repeat-containing protein [Luteolibacter sp. Populi]|uniref:beta strand repeat-containing protein n=1 Tax=Luteolibacter sp. Populi TaxID=3230487 RepID=UPI003467AC02
MKLPPLPPHWASSDIGGVGAAGDAGAEGGTHVVYGSGADIWGTADEFRFVRQAANGDCDFRARVTGQGNTNGYAKAGVMLRDGIAANAAHASIYVTPANGFSFQYRGATGGASTNVNGPVLNAGINNWVRLTRVGDLITSYVSADGMAWTTVGATTIAMPVTIQAGLAVTSHVDAGLGGAVFDRVSLGHVEPSIALVQDGFNGTAANDAAEALDVAWSGSTLTVAADAALGGGSALNVDGGTYASVDASFAGRALVNTGDVLKLSFDFRYTQASANMAAGFRFGLFNNSGDGFAVQHGTGGNGSWTLIEDGGSDGSFGFGGLTTVATGSKASINDQVKHSISLLLRKVDTGIAVTATVDGISLSGTDTSPALSAFDTVLISNGNMTADYRIDNVRVDAFQLVAPLFTSDPFTKATAAVGGAYSGTLTSDVNVAHPGHVYEKVAGPAWLTVAANGNLTGSPAAGDMGMGSFTVKVTNEEGASDQAEMQIPVAYPVTLTATDAAASEDDLSTGTFTFTRGGPTTSDLTVGFSVSGTALAGSDYVAAGSNVVIPAGQASATVTVVPLDDALLEASETVALMLVASADYAMGVSTSATVTIADDESLFVRMNDGFDSATATAGNDGDDPFDVAWNGSTLTVAADTTFNTGKALNVDTTGTFGGPKGAFAARSLPVNGDSIILSFDFRYTAAPTNVSAGLRVGLYNSTGAGFCLHHGTGGNTGIGLLECPDGTFGSGALTGITSGTKASINDQLKHTISLKLRRTAGGMVVTSTVDGVSHTGTESTPVITSFDTVLIANGGQTVDFRLDNVRVEFSPNLAPAFASNPLVRSAVIDVPLDGTLANDAVDPNAGDTFTFAKIAGASWLSVASNGALSGTPAIANAGANSFTIRMTDNHGVFADAMLTVNVGYPVTVAASAPVARESAEIPGAFLISRGGPVTVGLTVSYTTAGTAVAGDDYGVLSGSVVIPAGESSVVVPLLPIDDGDFEDDETAVLVLSPNAAYAVSAPANAVVTIADDETELHAAEDTFDVGAAPTAGNDADDPDDLAWTATAGTLSVVEDAILESGNALLMDATGTFALTRANFAAIPLVNTGDSLRLSFDFRYTQAPASVGSGLRFGLFNSAGDGFLVQQGIGGATGWALAEDTAADGGFGSGGTVTGLASGARASVNDLTPHAFSLTLTKTATGILIAGGADGAVISFSDTTPVVTSFDAIGIRHGNLTADFAIDNVHLEVVRNRAPSFTTAPLVKAAAAVSEGYAESLAGDAGDPNEGDTMAFSKQSGPGWLTVAADGALGGTPGSSDAGANSFVVRVTDHNGLWTETMLGIEVTNMLPPLEAWRGVEFGAESGNPLIAGNDGDPDHDGLANLLEYALGLDPESFSVSPAVEVESGVISITYTVNLLATDVTIAPKWSDGLESWETAGITLEILGEVGSVRTVKASLPAGSPAKFLRVEVQGP